MGRVEPDPVPGALASGVRKGFRDVYGTPDVDQASHEQKEHDRGESELDQGLAFLVRSGACKRPL